MFASRGFSAAWSSSSFGSAAKGVASLRSVHATSNNRNEGNASFTSHFPEQQPAFLPTCSTSSEGAALPIDKISSQDLRPTPFAARDLRFLRGARSSLLVSWSRFPETSREVKLGHALTMSPTSVQAASRLHCRSKIVSDARCSVDAWSNEPSRDTPAHLRTTRSTTPSSNCCSFRTFNSPQNWIAFVLPLFVYALCSKVPRVISSPFRFVCSVEPFRKSLESASFLSTPSGASTGASNPTYFCRNASTKLEPLSTFLGLTKEPAPAGHVKYRISWESFSTAPSCLPRVASSHSTPYHVAFGSFVDVATGPTYLIVPRKSLSSLILVPTNACGVALVASRRALIFVCWTLCLRHGSSRKRVS
mmetsp:Transcript_19818/g.56304  ORF Transcript_19818/g.56304 Transcript_19818/m.56304 type:complete len:362 (+) Transcript_19818:693-1778(+)